MPLFPIYATYTTITTIICLFDILLCLQPFCKQYNMFVLFRSNGSSNKADSILTTCRLLCLALLLFNTNSLTNLFTLWLTFDLFFKLRPFSSQATALHTRLTQFLLLVVCFVLRFYSSTQTV